MTQHSCTATAVSPRQSPPPRGICGAESAPGPAGTRGWRGRAGTAAGTDRDCPGAGHPQLGKQPGNLAGSAVRVCFALYLTCARTAAFLFFPFTQNNPLDSLRFTTFFFFLPAASSWTWCCTSRLHRLQQFLHNAVHFFFSVLLFTPYHPAQLACGVGASIPLCSKELSLH